MSESVKSYRKPYVRPVSPVTWWAGHRFYTLYMLRELTAVTALFAACEMVLGVFLFAMCNLDAAAPATSTTAAPYVWFVTCFLGNPLVIILNLGALAAAIFHAITWFNLMPKAVRLFMNKNSTELLPSYVVKFGLYGALGGATLVILIFAIATI